MAPNTYKENHYVPCWYQERFLPSAGQRVFRYLDLQPEQFRDPNGVVRTKTALHRWGAKLSFKETDLYTTRFGSFESTDIERFFFGRVDREGKKAIEFFSDFNGFGDGGGFKTTPSEAFNSFLNYLSIQKFRTPKGLRYLSTLINTQDKNKLLLGMQQLQNLHCAIWTECVWAFADANNTRAKFILSDHPITLYNREIFPESEISRKLTDPDFRLNGTHTLFPISPTRVLILTHLSWVRNPYGNGKRARPNPQPFRTAIFNFTDIQTGRELEEIEVNQINYIVKRRALRYIAAAEEECLYPENALPSTHWRKLDDRYLLMPDPRCLHMGGEIMIGYVNKRSEAFDAYGRRPWQKDYTKEDDGESRALYAFQGEFARLFGARRRGTDYGLGRRSMEDSPDFHQYHLDNEAKFRPSGLRPRRDTRSL
jgi:hypothetical protein